MFANKNPTKFECRFKMMHSGPDWKKDPRTKSDKDKDPLSHLQHTRKFKTKYPPGTILKLDYNKNGEPTLLRMRTEFVQDALQVKLEWDEVLDEEGNAFKQARLEKVWHSKMKSKLFSRRVCVCVCVCTAGVCVCVCVYTVLLQVLCVYVCVCVYSVAPGLVCVCVCVCV